MTRFLVCILTALGVIEAQYWFAPSFIFSELFLSISRYWSEVPFNGEVRDFTSALCLSSSVCVFLLVLALESSWLLAIFNFPQMSPEVAARQNLGFCHSQFRTEDAAFLDKMLGCSPDTTNYTVLCVLLLRSTLSFRFAFLKKWPVCCIGSNITTLCGVVHFATCLTGWINSFWSFVCSNIAFTVIVVIIVVVGKRVVVASVFVSRIILSASSLCFLFFKKRNWFLWFRGFLQWWHIGLGF